MSVVQCAFFTPGGNPVPAIMPGTVINLDYTATAATTSAAIGGEVVSIVATTDCWISVGAAPTAVSGQGIFIPAKGNRELFFIDPTHKISAIRNTANGKLNIVVAAEV